MPTRICVAVMPDTTVFRACARASELRPRSRAWSWSTRMRTVRAGSIPVVVDIAGARVVVQNPRDSEGDGAHLLRLNTAHPVLHRPTNRRPEFQGIDPS